jgi:hypothetical protein
VLAASIAEQYPASGGQLVVTMKVSALDPSTMTPNASWTTFFDAQHADGSKTTYFVSVTQNSLSNPTGTAFTYGFTDTTGASPINRTVATADGGVLSATNKTLQVTLALNKLKKPVAATGGATLTGPTVDLSAGKQLTNVNAVTTLLIGVAGNGSNRTVDSTSASTYTMAGAAACTVSATPTPTPTPGDPATCNAPGVQVLTDPAGDQTGAPAANQHLDLLSMSIAEPVAFDGNGNRINKMIFTIKVSSLPSLQPNSIYRNEFVYKGTTYHVSLVTDSNGNPSYNYGTITTGVSTAGAADAGSFDATKGTISITISNSKVGNPQPGETITGVFADARLNGGGAVFAPIDTTSSVTYTLAGSSACSVGATPTPTPTPITPGQPTPPTTVTPTDVAGLLAQAESLFAQAQTALAAGDLGKYQSLINQAADSVRRARALADPSSATTTTSTPSTTAPTA